MKNNQLGQDSTSLSANVIKNSAGGIREGRGGIGRGG